jgi:hypothetical protein
MPAQYEHIRDSYIARGKSPKVAKKLAAMTYNAHRPKGAAPVGPHSDEHKAKARGIAQAMHNRGLRR